MGGSSIACKINIIEFKEAPKIRMDNEKLMKVALNLEYEIIWFFLSEISIVFPNK